MFKIRELEKELGIGHMDDLKYAETVGGKMRSLTNHELVELGAKYIPGLDARGALTFLIEEILNRVKWKTTTNEFEDKARLIEQILDKIIPVPKYVADEVKELVDLNRQTLVLRAGFNRMSVEELKAKLA